MNRTLSTWTFGRVNRVYEDGDAVKQLCTIGLASMGLSIIAFAGSAHAAPIDLQIIAITSNHNAQPDSNCFAGFSPPMFAGRDVYTMAHHHGEQELSLWRVRDGGKPIRLATVSKIDVDGLPAGNWEILAYATNSRGALAATVRILPENQDRECHAAIIWQSVARRGRLLARTGQEAIGLGGGYEFNVFSIIVLGENDSALIQAECIPNGDVRAPTVRGLWPVLGGSLRPGRPLTDLSGYRELPNADRAITVSRAGPILLACGCEGGLLVPVTTEGGKNQLLVASADGWRELQLRDLTKSLDGMHVFACAPGWVFAQLQDTSVWALGTSGQVKLADKVDGKLAYTSSADSHGLFATSYGAFGPIVVFDSTGANVRVRRGDIAGTDPTVAFDEFGACLNVNGHGNVAFVSRVHPKSLNDTIADAARWRICLAGTSGVRTIVRGGERVTLPLGKGKPAVLGEFDLLPGGLSDDGRLYFVAKYQADDDGGTLLGSIQTRGTNTP